MEVILRYLENIFMLIFLLLCRCCSGYFSGAILCEVNAEEKMEVDATAVYVGFDIKQK